MTSGSICWMSQVTLLSCSLDLIPFYWHWREKEKTLDSCLTSAKSAKAASFFLQHSTQKWDLVLECLVETRPCSHLPLHPSAGFDRGKESICPSHWGQQVWTCFLGRERPGPLPEKGTIPADFYSKIISLCLIPSFNVEWLQFGTCMGQHLSSHYVVWGLTLYQNSCRGFCQNAK